MHLRIPERLYIFFVNLFHSVFSGSDVRDPVRLFTFLLMVISVKMECTRQVFENMAPNAKENPAINNHARAAHMYGNILTLVIRLLRPRNMTLVYVNMAPMMIRLFRCGLDIFMYLEQQCTVIKHNLALCCKRD